MRNPVIAWLLLFVLTAPAPVSAGDLQGTVTVLHKNGSKPLSSFENTAVYLKGEFGEVPAAEAVLGQKDKKFIPRLLVAMKGQNVVFKNGDKIKHNIFSKDLDFDVGYMGHQEEAAKSFDRPGMYKIYCNIHKDMVADLVITGNPYYAVTDDAGAYAIKNIPEGRYTLVAEHIYGGRKEVPIDIGAAPVSVDLTLESTQVIRDILEHPNKYGQAYDGGSY